MEMVKETKENVATMNLLTNREATIQAIEEIEGSGFFEKAGDHSILAAIDFLNKMQDKLANAENNEDRRMLSQSWFMVYGSGGMDRYFVRSDGGVEFSLRHAIDADRVKKAEVLGFKLFK